MIWIFIIIMIVILKLLTTNYIEFTILHLNLMYNNHLDFYYYYDCNTKITYYKLFSTLNISLKF